MVACRTNFNSIKVRLELVSAVVQNIGNINFNSIKVRLEPIALDKLKELLSFQFHKGTIRTSFFQLLSTFQVQYFNSIKVRLEPKYIRAKDGVGIFQFHKGTIRTSPNTRGRPSRRISIP